MLKIRDEDYELTATCATFVRAPTGQLLVNLFVEGAVQGMEARLMFRNICLSGSSPDDLVGQSYQRTRGVLGPFPENFIASILLGEHFELRNSQLTFGSCDGETIDVEWACEMTEIGESKNPVPVTVSAVCWLEERPFERISGHCESKHVAADALVGSLADAMDGVFERLGAELATAGWFDRVAYHSIEAVIIAGDEQAITELRPSPLLNGSILHVRVPIQVEPLKRIAGDPEQVNAWMYEATRKLLDAPAL